MKEPPDTEIVMVQKACTGMEKKQAKYLILTRETLTFDFARAEQRKVRNRLGEGTADSRAAATKVSPASVAGSVLLSRRGKGLCELMYLILHRRVGKIQG
jgi:hypothetical protein